MNTKDELKKILVNNAQSWNKEETQDRAFIYVDDFLSEVEGKFKLLPIPDVVESEAVVCPKCKSEHTQKRGYGFECIECWHKF